MASLGIASVLILAFLVSPGIAGISKSLELPNRAVLEKIIAFRSVIQPRIYPNNSYVHQFIKDDFYIKQWLDEHNFVMHRAMQHFLEHLAWRLEHHVDTIHLENWDYFRAEYPQFINLSNKTCDIVSEVWTSDWNIRRATLVGQEHKLVRWSIYQLEMAQRNISKIWRNSKQKIAGCKAIDIVDMNHFNQWEHGCISCLNHIFGFAQIAEKHYPNIWTKVYMINVGPLFRQALATFGRGFKPISKGFMKIYTTKHEWLPVLEKEISKEQRSKRFGGNLIRDSDDG